MVYSAGGNSPPRWSTWSRTRCGPSPRAASSSSTSTCIPPRCTSGPGQQQARSLAGSAQDERLPDDDPGVRGDVDRRAPQDVGTLGHHEWFAVPDQAPAFLDLHAHVPASRPTAHRVGDRATGFDDLQRRSDAPPGPLPSTWSPASRTACSGTSATLVPPYAGSAKARRWLERTSVRVCGWAWAAIGPGSTGTRSPPRNSVEPVPSTQPPAAATESASVRDSASTGRPARACSRVVDHPARRPRRRTAPGRSC